MGVFDGFLNMMRLGPDDDDDFYDDGYEDEVEEKPKPSGSTGKPPAGASKAMDEKLDKIFGV